MRKDNLRGVRSVFLPQELIIEILLRLPVKSLVRFKCVCKLWLSLISDPHFAISHFEQAAIHNERLVLLAPCAREFRSIDFNASLHDNSASAALKLDFLPPKPYYVRILGSCRGFVLLDCCQSLHVWNPSTGVHKQVPRSPIVSDMDVRFFTFLYGFGYDPSTHDYLVVQASNNPSSDDYATRVEFFSLGANAWKEIEGIHLSYMNYFHDVRVGSLLNGALHWITCRYDLLIHVVVVFDLMERSFSEIPLPVDFDIEYFYDYNFCQLGILGECLSICVVGYYCSTEIWVMKEYKVQSSWTKTIVVCVDDIPNRYFSQVCCTKSGDIVGITGTTGLVKCNDKGQLQEHRSYCNGPKGYQVTVYTESLLSLPSGSKLEE
ncbi:hypothetical protein AAZX31_16G148100 [Glycine max]|uniref:F-box/kelch-repeat protein At3g06240 isoform X1 n=1 Tax=Glycine max TaxID=3847 RepID=UPI000233E1E3|nr:F-box/kelch-repeat protein At3g06240 isoform X1 [Glycine max]KAG4380386.1 hypothetical protein GLYMA_16G163966v4 [Glycine max]KAG4939520.1 hypothetical protein JHK86_045661 [Glycine max]KAG5100193.1 hypothetical protein JHK82_045245 [Glycine max]KAH1151713.1 hypothetical protein GYH30_045284 [Glycine max]|eukprot:XP_014624039.1 F-box/kelch-repeat protein At3g06240 [Glycine max]